MNLINLVIIKKDKQIITDEAITSTFEYGIILNSEKAYYIKNETNFISEITNLDVYQTKDCLLLPKNNKQEYLLLTTNNNSILLFLNREINKKEELIIMKTLFSNILKLDNKITPETLMKLSLNNINKKINLQLKEVKNV